jgi:hypothetical protein
MQVTKTYQLKIDKTFDEVDLQKGVFLTVLHATRTPPHIGLIIDKQYHSLTIKGAELNIAVTSLLRTVHQRKIPTLFIQLKPHSTFSASYLKEHFIINVQEYPKVDVNIATCLSPIKRFLEETYLLSCQQINYLYELVPFLDEAQLILSISALNIDESTFKLPIYNLSELNNGIAKAHQEAVQIKNATKKHELKK